MGIVDKALKFIDLALGVGPGEGPEERSIALAETIPSGESGRVARVRWNERRAVEHGMLQGSWAYTCINTVAKNVASIELGVYDPEGTRHPEHPLDMLLMEPNEHWTQPDLVERLAQHLLLSGNFVMTKVRDERGIVGEIWELPVQNVKPVVTDGATAIESYRYEAGGKRLDLDPANVVHGQLPDPAYPWWGLSPYRAAEQSIDTDKAAVDWNKSALQNRAVSDCAVAFDRPLSRKQWLEARWRMRQQHQGSSNARMPWVLGSNASIQPIDRSPVDMDFLDGRRLTREEIAAIFGVPPNMIGILDRATYSNFDTAHIVFWTQTLIPMLNALCRILTLGFKRDFALPRGWRVGYSRNDIPVATITSEETQDAGRLHAMGVPFHLINAHFKFGLPRFAGDDVSYIAGTLQRADLLAVDPFLEAGATLPPARALPAPTNGTPIIRGDLLSAARGLDGVLALIAKKTGKA